MARKKKINVDAVGKPKVRVTLPEGFHRNYLFGAKCEMGDDGRLFVVVDADPFAMKLVRDLHPDWEISEPFYEVDDVPEIAE